MTSLTSPLLVRWRRRSFLAVLISLVFTHALTGPATALASELPDTASQLSSAQAQHLSNQAFAPWFDSSIPWDGNWGALNSNDTEKLSGACELTSQQLDALHNVLPALQDDQSRIEHLQSKTHISAAEKQAAFKNDVISRLTDGTSTIAYIGGDNGQILKTVQNDNNVTVDSASGRIRLKDAKSVDLKNESLISLLPQDYASHPELLSDFDTFYSNISSSPKYMGCHELGTTLGDMFKQPSFFAFFKNPVTFFANMMAWMIGLPFLVVYKLVSPFALGLSLTTPHSERGDTLVDSYSTYAHASKAYNTCGGVRDDGHLGAAQAANTCTEEKAHDTSAHCDEGNKHNADQLGFNCENLISTQKHETPKSWWIQLTVYLRDGLSAVYGMIVIVCALFFMFRRSPGSQLEIKEVLPRVFVAVLLSASAPYWIGGLISMSNWFTQGVVGLGGSINDMGSTHFLGLTQTSGSLPDRVDSALNGLSQINTADLGLGLPDAGARVVFGLMRAFMLTAFAICYAAMVGMAIGRQIALIALIIMTPVACLGYALKGANNLFGYWVRGLLAVVAIPMAQSVILVMGLAMSQAFWDGHTSAINSAFGIVGRIMSMICLLVALKLMLSCVKQIRGMVTGNTTNLTRSILGRGVQMGGQLAGSALMLTGNVAAGNAVMTTTSAAGTLVKGRETKRQYIPQGNGILKRPQSRQPNELPFESAARDIAQETRRWAMLKEAEAGRKSASGSGGDQEAADAEVELPAGSAHLPAASGQAVDPSELHMSEQRHAEIAQGDFLGEQGQSRIKDAVREGLSEAMIDQQVSVAINNAGGPVGISPRMFDGLGLSSEQVNASLQRMDQGGQLPDWFVQAVQNGAQGASQSPPSRTPPRTGSHLPSVPGSEVIVTDQRSRRQIPPVTGARPGFIPPTEQDPDGHKTHA